MLPTLPVVKNRTNSIQKSCFRVVILFMTIHFDFVLFVTVSYCSLESDGVLNGALNKGSPFQKYLYF